MRYLYGGDSVMEVLMAKGNKRIVYLRPDKTWVNKKNDASKASSVHQTQREAEQVAKEMLRRSGGVELTTKGENGQIRSKDTVAPAVYPNPPKDREH